MRARLVSQSGLGFAGYAAQNLSGIVWDVPDGTEGTLVTVAGKEHMVHWLRTDDDLWVPVKRENYEPCSCVPKGCSKDNT